MSSARRQIIRRKKTKYSGSFLIRVITMYRGMPCLWRQTDSSFNDRSLRDKAMNRLVQLFRTVNPKANKETVLMRINAMKFSYLRNLKAVRNARKKGEEFIPKLWYFELLQFLEKSKWSNSDCDSSEIDSFIEKYQEDSKDKTSDEIELDNFLGSSSPTHGCSSPQKDSNKRPHLDIPKSNETIKSSVMHEDMLVTSPPETTSPLQTNGTSAPQASILRQAIESPSLSRVVQAYSLNNHQSSEACSMTQAPLLHTDCQNSIAVQASSTQASSTYAPHTIPASSIPNANQANFTPQAVQAASNRPAHFLSQTAHQGRRRKVDKILKLVEELDSQMTPKTIVTPDKGKMFASFGKYVSGKLCHMPPEMVSICQKLISDAIFYAETNNLNMTSHIVSDTF